MYSEERKFLPLYITRFSISLGITALLNFIAIYADLFEASGFWVGMFTTSYSTVQLVTLLPIGWISDRFNKKKILLGGLAVLATSYVGFIFVSGVVSLTVTRVIQGIGFAAAGTTCLAITGELAPEETRGKIIGTSNAWRLLSSALGSVAGGWMVQRWGFTIPYLVLAFATILSALLTYIFVEEDEARITGFTFKAHITNRRIQSLAWFRSFYAFSVMMVRIYVPVFARLALSLSAFQVGALLATEKLTNMLLQRYSGKISDQLGRFTILSVGGSAYALGAIFIPFQSGFWGLIAINGFLGVADSLREPASMALFAEEGQGSGIASSISLRSIIWRPGSIIAPLIGGLIMDWVGFGYVFWLASAFSVIGLVFMGVSRMLYTEQLG
ncbi:MFS transporter [Candidatus Bipolaricaulota bacterium]|nr:MFS transporter [Candidatus Bipolaricaulota bacterium]